MRTRFYDFVDDMRCLKNQALDTAQKVIAKAIQIFSEFCHSPRESLRSFYQTLTLPLTVRNKLKHFEFVIGLSLEEFKDKAEEAHKKTLNYDYWGAYCQKKIIRACIFRDSITAPKPIALLNIWMSEIEPLRKEFRSFSYADQLTVLQYLNQQELYGYPVYLVDFFSNISRAASKLPSSY